MSEFEKWESERPSDARKISETRYYKGLGTSTTQEAMDYFSDMPRHTVVVDYARDADESAESLRSCFGKEREQVEERVEACFAASTRTRPSTTRRRA